MFLAADSLFRIIGFDSQLIFDSIITGINVFILFSVYTHMLEKSTRITDGEFELKTHFYHFLTI